jgi:Histidine kinase-, DNA gyrase B-, and HSP90-like ATPase
MIADLFELARLDMGETPLRPEIFSVGELVQDVCQVFRLGAESKGVELVAEVHAPGSFVEGDIGLIERAMANLLDNAIKFTDRGGSVSVTVTEERGRVVTRVADTGVGIPAGDIANVFDRLYRVGTQPPFADGTGSRLGHRQTRGGAARRRRRGGKPPRRGQRLLVPTAGEPLSGGRVPGGPNRAVDHGRPDACLAWADASSRSLVASRASDARAGPKLHEPR